MVQGRILRICVLAALKHGRKADALAAVFCLILAAVWLSLSLAIAGAAFAAAAWFDLTAGLIRGRPFARGR